MSQINAGRVIIGGMVAGVVMNLIDAGTNGFWLAKQWAEEADLLNPGLMKKVQTTSTVGWILVDFMTAILLVWLYAAIRPRFGPGPKTAVLAGLVIWLITHGWYFSYVFMGLFSLSLIGASSLGGLVAALAGGYLGGMLYQE